MNISNVPIIGYYDIGDGVPKQNCYFKSPNLTIRLTSSGYAIFDSATKQNVASAVFDSEGNFKKASINDISICQEILSRQPKFPLREVLEESLEKTEIPYFGANFWQEGLKI